MFERFEELKSRLKILEADVNQRCIGPKNISFEQSKMKAHTHNPKVIQESRPRSDRPKFQNNISTSQSPLTIRTNRADQAAVSSLLAQVKELDSKRIAEKASLQHSANLEKQRALKAEKVARKASQKLEFKDKEVRHLKSALQRRDDMILSLQDEVRKLQAASARIEDIKWIEEERDSLQSEIKVLGKKILDLSSLLDEKTIAFQNSQQCLHQEMKAKERETNRATRIRQTNSSLLKELEEQKRICLDLQESCLACKEFIDQRKGNLEELLITMSRHDFYKLQDNLSDTLSVTNTYDTNSCDLASQM